MNLLSYWRGKPRRQPTWEDLPLGQLFAVPGQAALYLKAPLSRDEKRDIPGLSDLKSGKHVLICGVEKCNGKIVYATPVVLEKGMPCIPLSVDASVFPPLFDMKNGTNDRGYELMVRSTNGAYYAIGRKSKKGRKEEEGDE